MDNELTAQLTAFNQIYKEIDDAYHGYAKLHELSDTAFWVLYSLARLKPGSVYTQRELCADWSYSPQTVNSALKQLEKQGLIRLSLAPGSRKHKQLLLTERGAASTKEHIEPLMEAERNAFAGLCPQERCELLSALRKHSELLKSRINEILNTSSEDWSPQ